MNSIILIGKLGRDPELSYLTSGTAICKFSLAVDRVARAGDEKQVDWFNIVVFGAQGENANRYLKKGNQCAVMGRVQTGNYTDRQGVKRNTFDIIADRVEFLTPRQQETQPAFRGANVPQATPPTAQPQQVQLSNDEFADLGFMGVTDGLPY